MARLGDQVVAERERELERGATLIPDSFVGLGSCSSGRSASSLHTITLYS